LISAEAFSAPAEVMAIALSRRANAYKLWSR